MRGPLAAEAYATEGRSQIGLCPWQHAVRAVARYALPAAQVTRLRNAHAAHSAPPFIWATRQHAVPLAASFAANSVPPVCQATRQHAAPSAANFDANYEHPVLPQTRQHAVLAQMHRGGCALVSKAACMLNMAWHVPTSRAAA